MSTQNPILPTATDLKGIDATIYDIDTHLSTSLAWLTNGQGRAYKLSKFKNNDTTVFLPEVYLGGNQSKYFAATPDNDKKGQSIFVLGNETYLNYRVGQYGQKDYELSIIFSINLKLIDPTLLLTEQFARHQIMEAEEALTRGLLGKAYRLVIDNCVTEFDDVYSGFDVSKEQGASLAPMSYFRFNCTVTLDEDCAGVSLNRCGAILQNLSSDDKNECILPTYDFSTAVVQAEVTAGQQTDLSTWLCPDVCTVVIPSLDFTTSGTDYECLSSQQVTDIIDRSLRVYTYYDGANERTTRNPLDASQQFHAMTPFTLSIWVENLSSGVRRTIADNRNGWTIWQEVGGYPRIRFLGTGTTIEVQTTSIAPISVFNHIVFTNDGSGDSAGVKIYINGVAQAVTASGLLTASVGSSLLQIATWNFNNNWIGGMDELLITSDEKTAAQVLEIYNIGGAEAATGLYPTITNKVLHTKLDTLNPLENIIGYNLTSDNQDASNIRTELI